MPTARRVLRGALPAGWPGATVRPNRPQTHHRRTKISEGMNDALFPTSAMLLPRIILRHGHSSSEQRQCINPVEPSSKLERVIPVFRISFSILSRFYHLLLVEERS